jgi:hypothetical protein
LEGEARRGDRGMIAVETCPASRHDGEDGERVVYLLDAR